MADNGPTLSALVVNGALATNEGRVVVGSHHEMLQIFGESKMFTVIVVPEAIEPKCSWRELIGS